MKDGGGGGGEVGGVQQWHEPLWRREEKHACVLVGDVRCFQMELINYSAPFASQHFDTHHTNPSHPSFSLSLHPPLSLTE